MATPQTAKTSFVEANGVSYAYRIFGPTTTSLPPLLLLQFFRATADFWNPLLVSFLASHRQVILFDNAGIGQSIGSIADSISGMAHHVETFCHALNLEQIDLLGFSLGGRVAQQVGLNALANATSLVRKLIVSASSPGRGAQGGEGVVDGDGTTTNKLAGTPETSEESFLKLFFLDSQSSREAGRAWFARIRERSEATSGEPRTVEVQANGIMAQGRCLGKWAQGEGNSYSWLLFASFLPVILSTATHTLSLLSLHPPRRYSLHHCKGSYDALPNPDIPVLVTNGKTDFMMPTINSYILSQRLPNGKLHIYPDSGHGQCFQFAEAYARNVNAFLDM